MSVSNSEFQEPADPTGHPFNGASILVTGGTGSFGKSFIRYVLDHLAPQRVIIFSRDELKQYECRQAFGNDPRLRWFIGDVRDRERLQRALHNVDYVVHAAALKQVDTGEYNPFEFIKTNVLGSQNVVEASIDASVKKVVALSTDKASSPINLYGATKLTADKIFTLGNNYAAAYDTRFSVVRYGNVTGSRGSIIPRWKAMAERGEALGITDMRCTRFLITLPQAVQMVIDTFELMQGGELLVPHIPSHKVVDLAKAVAPEATLVDIGLRPGEKLHEEMISPEEGRRAVSILDGKYYVIEPENPQWGYKPIMGATPVPAGFHCASDKNDIWYGAEDLRKVLESGI